VRMSKRISEQVAPKIKKIDKGLYFPRDAKVAQTLKSEHEKVYANARRSFTKNQIYLGGVPIYVDSDLRDEIIPKGT